MTARKALADRKGKKSAKKKARAVARKPTRRAAKKTPKKTQRSASRKAMSKKSPAKRSTRRRAREVVTQRRVFFFGAGQADGHAGMKALLGGKGANLAEMSKIGLPGAGLP